MFSNDLTYKSGDTPHLSEVRIVLLGSTNTGKSSAANTILGKNEFDLEGNAQCVMKQGEVAGRMITVVEAPGWQRYKAVRNSTESLKKEIDLSVSMCPPGPHAVLLVLRLDSKSWRCEKTVLWGYLERLPERMWSQIIVLFTVRDPLHDSNIKRHIARVELELRWLFEKCGNRYHVFNNSSTFEVRALLEKIEKMLAGNGLCDLEMDLKRETKEKSLRMIFEEKWCADAFPVRRPAKIVSPIRTTIPNKPVGLRVKEGGMGKTRLKQESKIKSAPTSKKHHQTGIHPFTPELVKKCNEDKNSEEYRFLCPHAGQFKCKLTNLVFETEAQSVVKYRIVSWDKHVLDGLNQTEPAGPLYDIDCLQGSICHLGLPHCETCENDELMVAHVTDGNVKIIHPLDVTDTHVIMNITSFSLLGLLKSLLFKTNPISAQVLLFHDERMNKLHIHLTPGNVPVEEVRRRHESYIYITTTSKCQLTPGQTYRPCCKTTDNNYIEYQPEEERFERNHGPNFHPTFEVLFKTEVNEVKLSLLDAKTMEVWKPRAVKLTSAENASHRRDTTKTDAEIFVDKYREQLIQRVSSVMEIVDGLKSKDMISDERYNDIRVASSSCKQMRLLYDAFRSGGRAVKVEFFQILKKKQPFLVEDLESAD